MCPQIGEGCFTFVYLGKNLLAVATQRRLIFVTIRWDSGDNEQERREGWLQCAALLEMDPFGSFAFQIYNTPSYLLAVSSRWRGSKVVAMTKIFKCPMFHRLYTRHRKELTSHLEPGAQREINESSDGQGY